MNKLFSVVLAFVFAISVSACAEAGPSVVMYKGHTVVVPVPAPGPCAGDGSSTAPAGAMILFASYKAGIAHPPVCQTPDMDFGIGPRAGITLKDPTLEASYDLGTNTLYCGSNVIYDGYDFRLHGGVKYRALSGCTNYGVSNSYFAKGTNCAGVLFQADSTDSHFFNNDVDGGGVAANLACQAISVDNGEMIQALNQGVHDVHHNRIHDVDQHFITWGGTGTIDAVANAFERCGFEQGGHCNASQFSNFHGTATFRANLYLDPQPDVSYTTGPVEVSFTFGSNQVTQTIATANQTSYRVGQHLTSSRTPGTAIICAASSTNPNGDGTIPVVTTLTLDTTDTSCTHPANATSSGSGAFTVLDMWPLGIVIPTRYQNDGSAVLGDVSFIGNYYAGPGPIKGTTYNIYCSGTTGSFTATGNYWDPQNAFDMFNLTGGGSCAAPHLGSGNIRTDTGATTPVP